MSDDLDDLKDAMMRATPNPGAAKKRANLALAEKNFADLQGMADDARPKSDRPERGLWTGVRTMFRSLTSPAALTASTACAAFGVALVVYWGEDGRGVSQLPRLTPSLAEDAEVAPAVLTPAPETLPRTRLLQKATPAPMAELSDSVVLGADPSSSATASNRLGQIAPAIEPSFPFEPVNSETFANAPENPLRVTAEDPVSTFSIDVDTASYAFVRNALMAGQLPNPDAVRIEEMINYFSYEYPAPDDAAFQPSVSVQPTPWNAGTQLVQIGIQGKVPAVADRPPLNLVFLIDTSGSMQQANKLPLLKQSFRLMLGQLRPEDEVSIITYAGSAGQALAPTPARERSTILAALDGLSSGGSTAGQAGLQQAYAVAETMRAEGELSRVILATDGDFNVGISDPEALKTYIAGKRDSGTYLSVLGFGRGNLQDATMQALAQNGNGQAAYIDTLSEAQKVLVDQLTGALFPIADDVKIQVEFNPADVAEYRLIGYETRALRREDFNNDAVDAGDIGAGHSVTALYEVTPVGSDAVLNRPSRYSQDTVSDPTGELGFLALRYKEPGADESQLIELPIRADGVALPDASFAAAIAGFGQLLRGGSYVQGWTYADAIALASAARGEDPFGYRAEAIQLMRIANSLSE